MILGLRLAKMQVSLTKEARRGLEWVGITVPSRNEPMILPLGTEGLTEGILIKGCRRLAQPFGSHGSTCPRVIGL